MDLEILEGLALSTDRAAALAQLLPGSEDHDYWRAVFAQQRGALDEAEQIVSAWPERHGEGPRYQQLRMRQLLHRVVADPAAGADAVRDWFGVGHWHEAEIAGDAAPARPSRLADGAFDPVALLQQAAMNDASLSQVTADGAYELIAWTLDAARRRVLLGRLAHTPAPQLVQLVADDLAQRGSVGFGSLAVHNQLTSEQLRALAALRPELLGHDRWIGAMVRRLRPPLGADLDDVDVRAAYLAELWAFVAALPPAARSLQAHVLWHLLDTQRRRGAPADPALVRAYLSLPREAPYLARAFVEPLRGRDLAQLGADFSDATGLPPAGSDEELVRALLAERLADAEQYAPWLDRAWLDAEVAAARLLAGATDGEAATRVLGPARAQALRERVELTWCVHNPSRFAADAPIALDVDVKNAPEVVVKVFRIDPLAYYQQYQRAVDASLDLDGLAASDELVLRVAEPAVQRVRRRVELPMCARPGTYVIDLIGNGMSSRAVIAKGRLRHVVRRGAAGHVVTIVDDAGAPRPDARAWIGDREYVPDARGQLVVPFSTAPGRTAMLLACGDIASVAALDLVGESVELRLALVLDRQGLAAGRTARAVARLSLLVGGAPASLALVERAMWDVTLTDLRGVATTKSLPLPLDDGDAAVLEWPLGDDTASVRVAVRGAVQVRSEQRTRDVSAEAACSIATLFAGDATEALYLAPTSAGWVLYALGKSGEPRARRPVTVGVQHRFAGTQLQLELATDERGRIELGALPGATRLTATLGALTQSFPLDGPAPSTEILHALAGGEVRVPIAPSYDAAYVCARCSLVELRGGAPAHHVRADFEPLAGAIAVRGLPPGDYALRGPGFAPTTIVIAAPAPVVGGAALEANELVELPRAPAVLAALALDDAHLRVTVRGADARTRVHAVATRFAPSLVDRLPDDLAVLARRRADRAAPARYVSGRELGDEYRYVLERRAQKRYPGLLVDKPSLLLNPWARRTTSTDIASAKAGGAFGGRGDDLRVGSSGGARGGGMGGRGGESGALPGYDFLGAAPAVLANLVPDADGAVAIPRAALGDACAVLVIVDDAAGWSARTVALPESPLAPRDRRLIVALAPTRHATQRKAIAPLVAGAQLVIEDLATAQVHLLDTVERAHAYLLALRDDAQLREFAFVARWHALPDAERRTLYSKYACHELHLFLYFRDRAFFDAVVKPYLAHRRVKTFLDEWLLGADLAAYLEPARIVRLNAVERALLAQRMPADAAVARILSDEVALAPPDPARDAHLIDALIGAATLDGDEAIESAHAAAFDEAESTGSQHEAFAEQSVAGFAPAPMASAPMSRMMMAPPRPAPAPMRDAKKRAAPSETLSLDDLAGDVQTRGESAPMYRAADTTQEWAETSWWRREPARTASDAASLIAPNRLWRDLATHAGGPFLSPALGLATTSFAEAMCALAVTDLPFVAAPHTIEARGGGLAITAAGPALAGSSQIVDGDLVTGGPPLVVGTSYVRADDRYEWTDGEQVPRYVTGALTAAVVYTCQVVLANPTSGRQRVAALVQIPRGSIAVGGARATHTIDVALAPYAAHGHEYSFYFPAPGAWSHFPVHVARGGAIVAAGAPTTLDVQAGGAAPDLASWAHVSQRGTLAEVVAMLDGANLSAIAVARCAWRLRERAAYDAILGALERRRAYDETLWGYALLHRDAPRIRTWLRALGERLLPAGPVLDALGVDAEALGAYEHLEFAPLVNARAHRLGAKLRILNDGLAAQYVRFLERAAHRAQPTAEELLAAAAYLLAQDRVEAALAALARVDAAAVAERMQYDYVAAYAACLVGDAARAAQLVAPWRAHPVDRWRSRFGALAAMLDEVGGAAPVVVDAQNREQQQADLAAKQPAFDLAADREGVTVRAQYVAALELRYFEMDVELLFSRQPFVQSDVSRFSFIEPGVRARVEAPPNGDVAKVPWPERLRGKNVVVEAVGAGLRRAVAHYANDLATNVANQYGQLRVQRGSDRAPLPATYVKVYARKRGGAVAFYKDGYTDLRGWFDYATLSTTELDSVERFAILVCSDTSGAAILEAAPPAR